MTKKQQGFAAMTPEARKAIARRGGHAAHASGKAHRFSPEEAKAAGASGGKAAQASGKAHRFNSETARAAVAKRHPKAE